MTLYLEILIVMASLGSGVAALIILRLAWGERQRSRRSVLIKPGHGDLDCRVSVRDLSKKGLRILVIQAITTPRRQYNLEFGYRICPEQRD